MAAAARRTVLAAMKSRTISITVSPPPVTFAERRSILQVLEQHGPVEFFKAVPGHSTMFVSVMKDPETMNQLISKSPLSYGVVVPRTSEMSLTQDLVAPPKLSKTTPITTFKLTEDSEPQSNDEVEDTSSKDFTLHVFPNPTYRHEQSGANSALSSSWPASYEDNKSFTTRVLLQSLPKNMAAKGLAYWDKMQSSRLTNDNKREERIQVSKWMPSKMKDRAMKSLATQADANAEALPKQE